MSGTCIEFVGATPKLRVTGNQTWGVAMSDRYSISEKELTRYLAIGTMIYGDEGRFEEACKLYGPDIPLAFLIARLRKKHESWQEIINELQYSRSIASLVLNNDHIYKLQTACYLIERIGLLAFEPISDSINIETATALFIGITRNGYTDWQETITVIRNSGFFREET